MTAKLPAKTNVDEQYLRKWEVYVCKWKRRTIGLGIALVVSAALVVPFLDNHFLHAYFGQGRYLIYVSCGLLSLFVGSAALTYNFWSYLRSLRAKDHSTGSDKKM